MNDEMLRQYEAARRLGTWTDLLDRGKIKVTGNDRVPFLHNILTQDIQSLKPGESSQATLLSATGKVFAYFEVRVEADAIWLLTEPGFEKKWVPLFEKFVITEDVKLEILEILYARKESAFSPEVLEILRIEDGILRYGIDMNEEVTLSETGLDKIAASETKGCYPGQEVVARTKTYGGLQRKITGLILETKTQTGDRHEVPLVPVPCLLPQRGAKIYSGEEEIGWITSACESIALKKGIALGYLKKGFFEEGREVGIQTSIRKIKARTRSLPFVSFPLPH